jgi:hypothetical protein
VVGLGSANFGKAAFGTGWSDPGWHMIHNTNWEYWVLIMFSHLVLFYFALPLFNFSLFELVYP